MSNKKLLLLIAIILLSLFCIVYLQRNINEIKEKYFIGTSIVLSDVPPVVAFTTVALGGFRGIAADILWLKTISLQEEGKYLEMVQLASWILKLQPKSTDAVSFLAWNMAYNISVIYADPEKKWQWVKSGINLLRDSIRYNPGNSSLCKELAWIYINKIGDKYDSSNMYYKTQLALDMEAIIGNDFGKDKNSWNLIEETPSDYEKFIQRDPSGKFISTILKDSEYKNIENLYLVFKKEWTLPQQFKTKFTDRKLLQSLTFYLKKRMFKEEFGLEPEKVIGINKKFGELDWRLYSSLALYWSYIGLSITKDSRECRTALNMALAATVLNGKILFIDKSDYDNLTTCPDFTSFPVINNYFVREIAEGNREDYANFYFSFAYKTIPLLCLYGKYEYANAVFDYLKKIYPDEMSNIGTLQIFLDSYWNNYFERNDKEQVINDISQYIKISYLLNVEDMHDLSESLKNNCQYIYDKYSKYYFNNKLPEFKIFYSDRLNVLQKNIK